jgi:hypothetical protein
MAIGTKELAPSELDTFEDQRLLEELRKAKEELSTCASSRPPVSWRATVASAP